MRKIISLTTHEFYLQNKVNNLTFYLIIFFLFYSLSIVFINDHNDIQKFGTAFSIIYFPLSLIGFSPFVFKPDIKDGSMEQMMVSFSSLQIVLAKLLSINLCAIISIIVILPLVCILFNFSLELSILFAFSMLCISVLSVALLVLISAVETYFKSNTNYLSFLIMPFLIPNIIIIGLVVQQEVSCNLIYIVVGINLIMLPVCIFLSSYLIKNIYNN